MHIFAAVSHLSSLPCRHSKGWPCVNCVTSPKSVCMGGCHLSRPSLREVHLIQFSRLYLWILIQRFWSNVFLVLKVQYFVEGCKWCFYDSGMACFFPLEMWDCWGFFLMDYDIIRSHEPWFSINILCEMKKKYFEPWFWFCVLLFSTVINNIVWL